MARSSTARDMRACYDARMSSTLSRRRSSRVAKEASLLLVSASFVCLACTTPDRNVGDERDDAAGSPSDGGAPLGHAGASSTEGGSADHGGAAGRDGAAGAADAGDAGQGSSPSSSGGADGGAECPPLDEPANGAIDTGETAPGTMVSYSCRKGYQISGATTRTCDPTGTWTGGEPACVRNSCAGGLDGADLDCGGVGQDCCARLTVPAGSFNRGNDAANPAKVSAFSLDKLEVTVGRFRAVVDAGFGTQAKPPTGAGWDPSFDSALQPDPPSLSSALAGAGESTWTAENDYLPMNQVTWHEALAFCLWDGGRLPTALEWDYAATGGSDQRKYPWGNTNPAADTKLAVYGCLFGEGITCGELGHIAPVGWAEGDKARWGQRDMGGSLSELTRDFTGNYPSMPAVCNDCVTLDAVQAPEMIVMGGNFSGDAATIASPALGHTVAVFRNYGIGFRCAGDP
jgi:formylglycine-generating enzyme required for sulfatase activity